MVLGGALMPPVICLPVTLSSLYGICCGPHAELVDGNSKKSLLSVAANSIPGLPFGECTGCRVVSSQQA